MEEGMLVKPWECDYNKGASNNVQSLRNKQKKVSLSMISDDFYYKSFIIVLKCNNWYVG